MKEIQKSVARFVELSKEFTTKEKEVYEEFNPLLSYNITGLIASPYSLGMSDTKPKTKSEQYKDFLKEKADRVERYEEYLSLQNKLYEYFNAIDKLNL